MKFNNITGAIYNVPLTTYNDLITSYVEIVKKVKGIKSIIQIGSFTAPGLSDIDIIVIVDNNKPPQWEEISIKKLLKGKEGYEVIIHDVFVYSEYLAKYIEGLFYLDRKKILYGKDIGGYLSEKKIKELKLILTFEYTVHRLETLVILTSLSIINIRDILLFISTLRHTYNLLYDFDIISLKYRDKKIQQIEDLRIFSLNEDKDTDRLIKQLNDWIIPSYKSIYESIFLLGKKLNYYESIEPKSWILNYKKLIYNIDNIEESIFHFNKLNKLNKLLKAKVLVFSMPNCVYQHIDLYKQIENDKFIDLDCLISFNLRYALANEHKKFINLNNYPIAKSYIIINNESTKPSDVVKKIFLKVLNCFPIFR